MTTPLEASPLGRATPLPERYDPALLFPVDRADARAEAGIGTPLPFSGHDAWTAWELAWLDASGRPQAAVGRFEVSAASPRIVDSFAISIKVSLATAVLGCLIGFAIAAAVVFGGVPGWIRGPLMTFSGVASNFAGVPLAFAFNTSPSAAGSRSNSAG